jgi:hypothetical protein
LDILVLNTGKGVPRVNEKTNPNNKANGGEMKGVKQRRARRIYTITITRFENTGIEIMLVRLMRKINDYTRFAINMNCS